MGSIERFLAISYGDGSGDGSGDGYGYGSGSGDGSGYGSGDGYGDGYGYGSGYGSGDGSGYGSGYGSGSGSGDGSGIKEYDKRKVYYVDGISTLIYSVKRNYAKGAIINNDLTLSNCYIAKRGNYFAHGETLQKAVEDAERKHQQDLPVEDRIAAFKEVIKGMDKIPAQILYDSHTLLTGSCDMGKDEFIRSNNINMKSSYTLDQFISMTKDQYGGDVIKQLKE